MRTDYLVVAVVAAVVVVVAAGAVFAVMGEVHSPAAAGVVAAVVVVVVVVVAVAVAAVAVADCPRENRPRVSNQLNLGVVDARSVCHRPVGTIDGLGRWGCCRRPRRVLGLGNLPVRSEWAVVGRKAFGCVETVEGRLVATVDTLTRREEVAGIGRVEGRMSIVEVFDRMGCDSGVEERLWGRDDETVWAAELVEVDIETALEHWGALNLDYWSDEPSTW